MSKDKPIQLNDTLKEITMSQKMTHDEIVALLAKMNVDIKQDDEELRVMEEESKKRDARRPYMLAEINRLIALGEEFREMQQQADISQKEKR